MTQNTTTNNNNLFNFNFSNNNAQNKTGQTTAGKSTGTTTSTTSSFNFGGFQTQQTLRPSDQQHCKEIKIPEDLKNQTIRAIIDKADRNLRLQTESFQRQASKIARCDRIIYDCMELITHLENQMKFIEDQQKVLRDSANKLRAEQEDFIDRMKKKTSEASYFIVQEDQRAKIYDIAQHLGNKYSDMESQLKEMVGLIEKSHHLSEVSSDMGKITKITNCHINSLQWIANQSDILDKKIEKLSERLLEKKNKM